MTRRGFVGRVVAGVAAALGLKAAVPALSFHRDAFATTMSPLRTVYGDWSTSDKRLRALDEMRCATLSAEQERRLLQIYQEHVDAYHALIERQTFDGSGCSAPGTKVTIT